MDMLEMPIWPGARAQWQNACLTSLRLWDARKNKRGRREEEDMEALQSPPPISIPVAALKVRILVEGIEHGNTTFWLYRPSRGLCWRLQL